MPTSTRILVPVCLLCLASLLPAQTKYVSSPKGLLTTEGNAAFALSTNRRYQGIDNTHSGNVMVIKEFAMRRNGTGNSASTAGTVDVTLDMGLANMGVMFGEMDKNHLTGTRKNVFKKTGVNFPNWGGPTTSPPAKFDFIVPFTSTFIYLGKNALLWDLTLKNGPRSGSVDRDYVFYKSTTGSALGTGCTATGQVSTFNHTMALQSNGAAMPRFGVRIVVGASNGPKSTGLLLSLAVADSNFTVPGWCSKVHAVPLAIAPLTKTDATGLLRNHFLSGPYSLGTSGIKIVSQLFAVDTGQVGSIALSNGRSGSIPVPPTGGHEAAYIWSSAATTPNSSSYVFSGGSIIARFGY